jgi:peptidoglycan hydrolase-like protein with peptidoglycan-binding domain
MFRLTLLALARRLWVAVPLIVILAAAGYGARASQMEGGGGSVIPGIIIDQIIRQTQPPPVYCEPPSFYNPRLGRCIYPRPEPQQVYCEPPSHYSRKLGRCIYPQPEPEQVYCEPPSKYSRKLGHCIWPQEPKPPKQVSCKWPKVRDGNSCVCAAGYASSKGKCIEQKAPKTPEVATDITRIQECLAILGYDPGPADGKTGNATRVAYRAFQEANGLAKRPSSLSDQPTQIKLYQLCEAPPTKVVETPPPTRRCLPQDLYDMIKATYGERQGVEPCVAACLPKPAFYSDAKLATVSQRYGVDWCESCIRLGTWLPLDVIRQIETAANVTLCASPPPLCYLPARPEVYSKTEIRTIYRGLPTSVDNESDIAIVIGNEKYQGDLPVHVYGHADADAVDQLLTEQLGYRKENIIDLRDATLADLERVFGTEENPGELGSRVSKDEPGDVFIYISSHGMAKEDGGIGYILPVDGRADDLDASAYPLQRLYKNIGKAGARTTMLMLEATFAKTISDLVDPPNIPELEVAAMPETPVPGLAVFTAADRDQHSLDDPEYGIGLFTRYMISGLAGEADVAPLGNGDSRIDSVELYVYTADMVRTAARKSFGLEQKPILSKIDNLVVGKLAGLSRTAPAIRAELTFPVIPAAPVIPANAGTQ